MKNKKGLKVFVIVAIVAVFLGGKEILSKKDSDSPSIAESLELYNSGASFTKILQKNLGKGKDSSIKFLKSPYVSVIHITGVISEANKTYNQEWLLEQIENAKDDPNNRGILLKIDSPGGTVYESDEAYLALQKYKRDTDRPVFAYFGSLAASGGYYIACSADYIYANRNTLTGSIGVIAGESIDATGLLEKMGIKITTITAGKNKNMGNYNSVLTDEQRSIMQSIADEAYEQFTGIVARSRDMDIEEVKALADGRIYTAKQAQKNGLVDAVLSFEDAKDDIRDYFLGNWEDDDESAENTSSESEISENAGSAENEKSEVAEESAENSAEKSAKSDDSKDSKKKKGEFVEFVEREYQYEENWMSLLSGAASFAKNPEASVYELLGASAGKCLYLYQ